MKLSRVGFLGFAIFLSLLLAAFTEAGRRRPQYVPDEIIVKFTADAARELEKQPDKSGPAGEPKALGLLKKLNSRCRIKKARQLFRNFRSDRKRLKRLLKSDEAFLDRKEKRVLARLRRARKGIEVPALDRIYRVKVELYGSQSLEDIAAAYNRDARVEYAELNYIVSADLIPNDPDYGLQWALPKIDAPQAWDIQTGKHDIVVAVIDTGVDYNHGDMDDNMWVNAAEFSGSAGVDDDENGYIDDIYGFNFLNEDDEPLDDNGHGTHCAGIIAAEGNNALNVAGVCWDVQIMALKFLDRSGSGNSVDAVEALYYAVENGADVVSNSWGGSLPSQALEDAIDYAHSQGVFVVSSAGNTYSTDPHYPAFYENVFSVAATDFDDERAYFSTYGPWVDIAAPGVDILSLRPGGGTMSMSGTSMSCPYVAGVSALMLSVFGQLQNEQLKSALMESADPIEPGVCASGRLNAHQALFHIVKPKGDIFLGSDVYNCSSLIKIYLLDSDLAGAGGCEVVAETDGGDFETVLLDEQIGGIGIFEGAISAASGGVQTEDGILQISGDEVITASYFDANDGTGGSAVSTDTAAIDCNWPNVADVVIGFPGRQPRITCSTDEPAKTRVLCGTSCSGPYNSIRATEPGLSTDHTMKLTGVMAETEYFFVIEAIDAAGNVTVDDNGGLCYQFTTTSDMNDVFVPADCSTIEEAVENCWDGRCVWLADGLYTGTGNCDIDFLGRAITVRGENGPENCIIDCNGSEREPHCGFIFRSGEEASSTLAAVTIRNGYSQEGGAIYCYASSPTIIGCVFSGNFAAALWNAAGSSPVVNGCVFSANFGGGPSGSAGAMMNYYYCSPIVTDCIFINNQTYDNGGAVSNCYYSDPTISGCTFTANSSAGDGGGIYNSRSNPNITNCSFRGISCNYSSPVISNCLISGNTTGGGILCYDSSSPVISNCLIGGNSSIYGGGIIASVMSSPEIRNCTITGNKAMQSGGGIYCHFSNLVVSNSILWDNYANDGSQAALYNFSWLTLNYTDIQYGLSGIPPEPGAYVIWGAGNKDAEPMFVENGCWADANDPNIIAGPNDPNAVWIDGDYHLLDGSPCINAGKPDYTPQIGETDLDGRNRILSGRVDMGCYEFNHVPVAAAGPDTTVYAWIDGTAEVALDGGGSYDDDGDELTYHWSWTADGSSYDVNGPNPTIELSVGQHVIKLVVNDGSDDSEPDYTTVTVAGPVRAHMRIFPRAINRRGQKSTILAWLSLPAGVSKKQIDEQVPLLLYPGGVEASKQSIFQHNAKYRIRTNVLGFFKTAELLKAAADDGPVLLEVVGRLKSGRYFYGRGGIKIVDRRWRRRWRR